MGRMQDQPQPGLRRSEPIGVREVTDQIWLMSFMHYDLGFFDHVTCRIVRGESLHR